MGELRRADARGGLYERLLQRLALALDEADSLERVAAEPQGELELRGLTAAELELIRAYLDHDLNWLRGWHAAAEELAQIEQLPVRAAKSGRALEKAVSEALDTVKGPSKKSVQLCCALCGVVVDWQPGRGVAACAACGSQLFRSRDSR
ncbi:hypothetical protein I0D00_19230 [Pseudomonas lalucatii]|uniref:Zinc ribbon domain-containing protein n=1 Tax=Pseudomonas lalucatii TaxID=1424203 RepID=A0ABS5Q647_9PSED|nr:hypothetical protein [Pseudomonas lalucatii]MBS7664063.1 hypothetical protein [Pseudomonas lalucatii]MBS7690845.1 hypothetical protein [Pseudomonas lalucatii]MBS7725402.1 hypothetical protein [Pseudomonas lalucatii]QVM86657.1 hypothetical protein I0D68_12705 [Pseudomonas lalucatii]